MTGSSVQPVMFSKTLFWALRGGVNSFHIKEVLNCHMKKSSNILRQHHCLVLPQSITQSPDFFFRQVGNLLCHVFRCMTFKHSILFCLNFRTFSLILEFWSVRNKQRPPPPLNIYFSERTTNWGSVSVSFLEF